MRTDISQEMTDAIEQHHTSPGYLIEINFPSPLRCSTRGTVAALGHVWISTSVQVEGITFNVAAAQKGKLTFFDPDGSIGSLLSHHGLADREIVIYHFDAEAIDHPVCVFVGSGGRVSGDSKGKIVIEIASLTGRTTYLPRRYIAPEFGFNHIVPDGAIDKVGTITHTWKVRR